MQQSDLNYPQTVLKPVINTIIMTISYLCCQFKVKRPCPRKINYRNQIRISDLVQIRKKVQNLIDRDLYSTPDIRKWSLILPAIRARPCTDTMWVKIYKWLSLLTFTEHKLNNTWFEFVTCVRGKLFSFIFKSNDFQRKV